MRKITQAGSTNRSERSSSDMTHIDQRSFNQPATGSGGEVGKKGEWEWEWEWEEEDVIFLMALVGFQERCIVAIKKMLHRSTLFFYILIFSGSAIMFRQHVFFPHP